MKYDSIYNVSLSIPIYKIGATGQIKCTYFFMSSKCQFMSSPSLEISLIVSNNPVKQVTIELTLFPKECWNAWMYDSWDFGQISSTCFLLYFHIFSLFSSHESLLQILCHANMSLIYFSKLVVWWGEEKLPFIYLQFFFNLLQRRR